MATFSTDWFSTAAPLLEKTLEVYKGAKDTTFLEIGTFEGRSTQWFLDTILTDPSSKIICIDTFQGSPEHVGMDVITHGLKDTFLSNMQEYKGRFRVLQGESQDILRTREFDNKISVAYVDGSHRASDVLTDLCLVYPTVKPGGLIICDDYMWNYNSFKSEDIPKTAIDSFLVCFKNKIEVINITWKTIIIRKL